MCVCLLYHENAYIIYVVLHSEVQSETDCLCAIIDHVGFDGMRLSKRCFHIWVN